MRSFSSADTSSKRNSALQLLMRSRWASHGSLTLHGPVEHFKHAEVRGQQMHGAFVIILEGVLFDIRLGL